MSLIVIDYSEEYFVCLQQGEIPQQRYGKFVLLANHDEEYVIFSPQGLSQYHANIVERFLASRSLAGLYNHKRDHFYPDSDAWKICGGGHWEIDEEMGTLRIFGSSQAYGAVELHQLSEKLHLAGGFNSSQRVLVG